MQGKKSIFRSRSPDDFKMSSSKEGSIEEIRKKHQSSMSLSENADSCQLLISKIEISCVFKNFERIQYAL